MTQHTVNTTATLSTTSVEILAQVTGAKKRTGFIITSLATGSEKATIAKGNVAAIANNGIVLLPSLSYYESNSEGYECWQGPVQAVADSAMTVSIVETFNT